MRRVYLDHNATAPLRPEARDAMLAAMDIVGNPSSVHAEGRAAKALVERARGQVAALVGCAPGEVVFTGSATEAAALGLHAGPGIADGPVAFEAAGIEHDCVSLLCMETLRADENGRVSGFERPDTVALQAANSETGVIQDVPLGLGFSDIVQAAGKIPVDFAQSGARMAILSAHKLGGPKGIGALIVRRGMDVSALVRGGGQEMGRRSGTENVIGIAGFGAAAEAAARDVAAGRWEEIEELRKILENTLAASTNATIFVGKGANRLPNTSCFATPGWKGESQVIQMDLAGFAISAGSACSSGKVRASSVLRAMGYDEETASSAIRVSLGLDNTAEDVQRFAEVWLAKERKFRAQAA
ncbi:cysteine desulfurase family protein [uncultured Roseobacter sp.]|uniref:cysteine desulfurase family protein n=1 Tax=uncultured Roseobacter sp. TaxID=114847 RepID=UPI0026291D4B|nr:cysteine desulfurase family protein [uncultured Roseobacter sp.]